MIKIFKISLILMKSFGDSIKGKNDKSKRIKTILMYLLIGVALLPTAFMIGLAAFGVTNILNQYGQAALVLGLGMTIVSMIVFFFGIFYVLSVFYYSKDVETLLPLPLSPGQIVGAKFLVTLFFEYLTELIIFVPIAIGYGIAMKAGLWFYFSAVVVFLLLPVAPLALAGIIDVFIMAFTTFAKNKDRFKMFSGIIGIVIALGFNFLIQKTTASYSDPEALKTLLAQGNNSMLATLSNLFPTNRLASLALVNESIIGFAYLIAFLLIMAAFFGLFYYLSSKLYFKGAIGINESSADRKKLGKKDFEKQTRTLGSLMACLQKEVRLLYRHPGYFVNCVLLNFLFPFILILPILAGGGDQAKEMKNLYASGASNLGIIFLVAAFITSSNSIASSAISREGRLLYLSKYIPVSPRVQLEAKLLSSLIFGVIASVMLMVVMLIFFEISIIYFALGLIVSILATVFTSLVGLLIDIANPKLNWDNDLKAVKQNMNVLLVMLITIIVGGVLTAGTYFVNLNLLIENSLIIGFVVFADVVLYSLLITGGVNTYSKLDG